ncbi:hypothetical protein RRF57_009119 [Xylaria bambusicola]|uniref:Uncharacterized protein n=1 Tax=Xylaria bambusicola TaxID=326684 RepID=A0AAN7UJ15_9PEZI
MTGPASNNVIWKARRQVRVSCKGWKREGGRKAGDCRVTRDTVDLSEMTRDKIDTEPGIGTRNPDSGN